MPIAGLKVNTFVRKSLDVDRVMEFAELIEAGEHFDPIQVTSNGDVVDGRHRVEAYLLAKQHEIPFEIVKVKDEIDLIGKAYRANTGGSLPPTVADREHTIGLLLERGETMQNIATLLGLPTSLGRKYAMGVKSQMKRAKLMRAAAAVTDGTLTVAKSAELNGVDLDDLREFMRGKPKRKVGGVAEMKRNLSKLFKSVSMRHSALLRNLEQMFDDGEVVLKQVDEIFSHLDRLQRQSNRMVSDRKSRFDAKVGRKDTAA